MTKRVDTTLARKRRERKLAREAWLRSPEGKLHTQVMRHFIMPILADRAEQSRRLLELLHAPRPSTTGRFEIRAVKGLPPPKRPHGPLWGCCR